MSSSAKTEHPGGYRRSGGGGSEWTVRFAPPSPGEYIYRLESTDPDNPDLNGREGRVRITAYHGANELLRHGSLRISSNKRYFEHADGTPFYWLGDTWWTGTSDRLSWEGFQKLTADRKAKGFTLVQIVVGLVPFEELAPSDPGIHYLSTRFVCRANNSAALHPAAGEDRGRREPVVVTTLVNSQISHRTTKLAHAND